MLFGRLLFSFYLAPGAQVNDLYSFALGIYLMVGIVIVAQWIQDGYATLSTHQAMTYLQQKLIKVRRMNKVNFRMTLAFSRLPSFSIWLVPLALLYLFFWVLL